MTQTVPRALIADDEPLLVQALESELKAVWPELVITDKTADGSSTIARLLSGQHDIAFLDIQMPMENGIEVMQATIEEWPDDAENPPPLFVFVTAHDEFAIDAFELAALDYVVKPVTTKRLYKTVERLQSKLHERNSESALNSLVDQVNTYKAEAHSTISEEQWLDSISAGVGDTVYRIPVNEIIMFEASDKYVVVHTDGQQTLIRESLKSLLPRLNPAVFRQIHRSRIVNLEFVRAAKRSNGSKMTLILNGSDETPVVSRLYRHLFKAM